MIVPNRDNPLLVSMARTLWVMAYADTVEEQEHKWSEEPPSAGGGEDWMDVAPDTPDVAFDHALMLLGHFESANRLNWPIVVTAAFEPESLDVNDSEALDSFGHYLVMSCLGHGVSWEDNHPNVGVVYPNCIDSDDLMDAVLEVLAEYDIKLLESAES